MAKKFYKPTKMGAEALELTVTIRDIMDAYAADGLDLSVRQLYYRLVARNAIPNSEPSYKRVIAILGDARLNGYLDWDLIVDRGRQVIENSHWDLPAGIIETCSRSFRYDLWADQPWHVEVMVEKQALEGVLEPVCQRWDVPFNVNKGYSSLSALHARGQRMEEALDEGRNVVVIYLGDHDPSGMDMTRDIHDRMGLFSGNVFYEPDDSKPSHWHEEAWKTKDPRRFKQYGNAEHSGTFKVDRIALNMVQIENRDIDPNPAKLSDSRAARYIAQYGDVSWELDAIEPHELDEMVDEAVRRYVDPGLYNAAKARQNDARKELADMAAKMRKTE